MIELIKDNTKFFFTTWAIVIFLNQLFIFGGCFASYCIMAALPHTGIIAALITYLKFREDGKEKKENKEDTNEALDEIDQYLRRKQREEIAEELRKVREEREEVLRQCYGEEEADPLKVLGDAYE